MEETKKGTPEVLDTEQMPEPEVIPRDYVEMTFVKETATGRGRNEIFIMENLKDGTMKVTQGRVGITIGRYKPKSAIHPYSDWDWIYRSRIARGYMATKTVKMDRIEVTKGTGNEQADYKPIEDPDVSTFVENLLRYAKYTFEASYTIRVDNISDEMIKLGEKILKELSTGYGAMSVPEFNNKLKLLYAVIPRRMDNLSKHLAKHKQDFAAIVIEEQDLFDIMVSQVRGATLEKHAETTILEANGVEVRPVTEEEEAYLKGLLKGSASKYQKAYRVINHETEKAFDEFANREGLSDGKENGICHLFHGTKHANVWSILTTGLKNRPPKDAVITGKAYGIGTYFAPDAIKSLGYTSRTGPKWANGDQAYGLMFICKVATGKPDQYYNGHLGCDSSLNFGKLQTIQPGALCTWAECRYSGFMMDEVIVYQDEQSTVEYILQIGM